MHLNNLVLQRQVFKHRLNDHITLRKVPLPVAVAVALAYELAQHAIAVGSRHLLLLHRILPAYRVLPCCRQRQRQGKRTGCWQLGFRPCPGLQPSYLSKPAK